MLSSAMSPLKLHRLLGAVEKIRTIRLNQQGCKGSHRSDSSESLSYGVISPFMYFPIHLFIALTLISILSSNKMVTQLMIVDIKVKN